MKVQLMVRSDDGATPWRCSRCCGDVHDHRGIHFGSTSKPVLMCFRCVRLFYVELGTFLAGHEVSATASSPKPPAG